MKNNYIYRIQGSYSYEGPINNVGCVKVADLGYWLSLGTAKADIKRMKENGIMDTYHDVWVEQIQIGRYHVPDVKLKIRKNSNGKWVNVD